MRTFWIIAFGLAWAITVPIAAEQLGYADFGGLPAGLAFLIGFAPAIAAIVAASRERTVRAFLSSAFALRAPLAIWAASLLLPAVILAGALALASSGIGDPIELGPIAAVAPFALVWFVLALGEEIGWRAYALPRLTERFGFWTGSTLLGLAWCVWHYPRLLASPYVTSFGEALPWIGLFSIQIVIANYVLCWIARRSRYSAVPAALFHAGFNFAATLYPQAATDLRVTAMIGLALLIILLFDRNSADQADRG